MIFTDASDGGVSRQHRRREKSRRRADWGRGRHARTHQPDQHRDAEHRFVSSPSLNVSRWALTLLPKRLSWPSRRDWALGADPGSVAEREAQTETEPAAVAAADLRSADHAGLVGSVRGGAEPTAWAGRQHQHPHHPAEDQEAQGVCLIDTDSKEQSRIFFDLKIKTFHLWVG